MTVINHVTDDLASSHIKGKVLTAKYFSLFFFCKQKMKRNTWTAKKNYSLLSYSLPKNLGSDLQRTYASFWFLLQYLSLKNGFSHCFFTTKVLVQIISILTQRHFDLEKNMFQSLLGSSCLKDSNRFFF